MRDLRKRKLSEMNQSTPTRRQLRSFVTPTKSPGSSVHSTPTGTSMTESTASTRSYTRTTTPESPTPPKKRILLLLKVQNNSPTNAIHESSTIDTNNANLGDLPTEVQQRIASFLITDEDVANLALVCKSTFAAMGAPVWHQRFNQTYDAMEVERYGRAEISGSISIEYAFRQGFQRNLVLFNGEEPHAFHDHCLENFLRPLILQSDAKSIIGQNGQERIVGRNHQFLDRYFQTHPEPWGSLTDGFNLVDSICRTNYLTKRMMSSRHPKSLVLIIQLCFLHIVLHPLKSFAPAHRFHESQLQVYRCHRDEPIFKGSKKHEINLPWLLHVANFFKFHLKADGGEGVLTHQYCGLGLSELPRPWAGKLSSTTKELGKHWKGAFTYLHEVDLPRFRAGLTDEQIDETSEENNGFQDLTFFFDIEGEPDLQFPSEFDDFWESRPTAPFKNTATGKTALPVTKDFFGLGYNGTKYFLNGRVHALPEQQKIPGFQRVSLVAYLPDINGQFATENVWLYEGCVMPGNQMILGRWWSAYAITLDHQSYSGPFIFWGTSGNEENKVKTVADALKFYRAISWQA